MPLQLVSSDIVRHRQSQTQSVGVSAVTVQWPAVAASASGSGSQCSVTGSGSGSAGSVAVRLLDVKSISSGTFYANPVPQNPKILVVLKTFFKLSVPSVLS